MCIRDSVWAVVNASLAPQVSSPTAGTSDNYTVVVGKADAPVTLAIYQDYMCPYCGEFERANRAALAKWGAWVNAFGAKEYGRPLFMASSADLSGSTNIAGFAGGYGDFKGYGYYERVGDSQGVLMPQEITEFANAGILAGLASVNLAADPEKEFDGFWGATSTYGSFSYLLYGPFRLYSQLAQDCQLKTGKVIYVAGHSGPDAVDHLSLALGESQQAHECVVLEAKAVGVVLSLIHI